MQHLLSRCLVVVSILGLIMSVGSASEIGSVVENFSLDDYRGKAYSLRDFDDSALVLVAFTGTQCPLAKLYTVRLNELAQKYSADQLAVIAINANVQDSITEIAASVRDQDIQFPVLKDPANRVADLLGAERTPEVFLLDQNRVLRYRGRIDDQYVVGIARNQAKREDVKIAIDELLAGKRVSVSKTEPIGCIIGRRKQPNEQSEVTYSNQIARIFQDRCVECHREGEIAPFSLTSYEDVLGWGEMISEVIDDRRMPPWHANPQYGHFENDRSMSSQEIELIHTWVKNGSPEGNPDDLPEPKQYTDGWLLPKEPDMVVAMRDEPYVVAAEVGPEGIAYQQFWVDSGLKEDKWVIGMQARPGNRAVVHHIIVYVYPGGKGTKEHSFLTAYVPGLRADPLPPGAAKKIPAGSWFRFEMHYTPVGTEQTDISTAGFVFTDPETVTHEVVTMSAGNHRFEIKPYLDNQQVTAQTRKSPASLTLLSMSPHMHLRGKSFRYEAHYPDGKKEILLDVPHYDFNWQTRYLLTEPMELPPGTQLFCTAHFDNSERNLANPDPSDTVTWGDQSWDEMMLGYFDVLVPVQPTEEVTQGPLDAKRILSSLDSDKNDRISLREAKPLAILANAFSRVDRNRDGEITQDELKTAIQKLKSR